VEVIMAVRRIKLESPAGTTHAERLARLEVDNASLKALMAAALRKGLITEAEIEAEKPRGPAK
jgi:hypothetical protein